MLHEPRPEDAEINGPLNEVEVLMDGRLATQVGLDTANWTLIFGGFLYTINSVTTDGFLITLGVTATLVPGAPDGITFAPPPFDIVGIDGGLAPPFADFPVHL